MSGEPQPGSPRHWTPTRGAASLRDVRHRRGTTHALFFQGWNEVFARRRQAARQEVDMGLAHPCLAEARDLHPNNARTPTHPTASPCVVGHTSVVAVTCSSLCTHVAATLFLGPTFAGMCARACVCVGPRTRKTSSGWFAAARANEGGSTFTHERFQKRSELQQRVCHVAKVNLRPGSRLAWRAVAQAVHRCRGARSTIGQITRQTHMRACVLQAQTTASLRRPL